MKNYQRSIAFGIVVPLSLWAAIASGSTAADAPAVESEEVSSDDDPVVEGGAEETLAFTESGVSFDKLAQDSGEQTELQFEESSKEFIGTSVSWIGQVEAVDESLFEEGSYEILVDVEGGDALDRATLSVTKEEALSVPKNSTISFTGNIDEITNLLGLSVKISGVTFEIR